MLKFLISSFTLTAILLTVAHSSGVEPPRHRFTVATFTTVNLPAGETESAMNALIAGLEDGGKIFVHRSNSACATAKCALMTAERGRSHRVLLGEVRRSERTLKKAGPASGKQVMSTDAFRLSVKVLNAASGKTEYTVNENAISLRDLDRAASVTAKRIMARYEKIPVPADPAESGKQPEAVSGDAFFSAMHAGVSIAGAKMGGGLEGIAKYGAGFSIDLTGEMRDVRGLMLLMSLSALSQKDLADTVDRAYTGMLSAGAGWLIPAGGVVSFIPGVSAGYACHAVEGVTGSDQDKSPTMRYYFDPLATAGLMSRISITPEISFGLKFSYSLLFEKENTGRMIGVSLGALYKIR